MHCQNQVAEQFSSHVLRGPLEHVTCVSLQVQQHKVSIPPPQPPSVSEQGCGLSAVAGKLRRPATKLPDTATTRRRNSLLFTNAPSCSRILLFTTILPVQFAGSCEPPVGRLCV